MVLFFVDEVRSKSRYCVEGRKNRKNKGEIGENAGGVGISQLTWPSLYFPSGVKDVPD